MSTPTTEDDLDTLPDAELLAMPGITIPQGWLTEFFGRKAALIHQQDTDELALELSGGSTRHLMIFPGTDPKEKQRREEEDRRRAWLAAQEMLEYNERSDRLLARIDEQQRVIEKRRKKIEDNALRLHDGRRVYLDGSQYRDENGQVLTGPDRDEAAALDRAHPGASTWAQKQDIDQQADELQRLREKVEASREGEGAPEEKRQDLSGYEQEFNDKIATRQAQMQATPDYGSSDYIAELGGDDTQPSTVPAFTAAAQIASHETIGQPVDTDTETEGAKNAPRPFGQGALKLG